MYQKIFNFVKYNNAFTIIFGLFFFGVSATFAASPDARDNVYSSKETVISVDNTAIISTDLNSFNFNLKISAITDDAKNYYVIYSYRTLAVENSVWKTKDISKSLTVSKEALDGKDLGLYLARELGENVNYELSYLQRVQKLEKEKGQSQKVVTTEYSGLIGKLFDPKQEVIEGYVPVIPEPEPVVPVTVQSNPTEVVVSTPVVEQAPVSTPVTPTETVVTTESSPIPTLADVVDEKLVQEVVEQLVPSDATITPASEPIQ